MAARWPLGRVLAIGAVFAAIGNFAFVWLAHQPPGALVLYVATALDQFGNGMAGTIFVVYLSLIVDPRYPGAQYAFLSGFAFMLPRLIAGSGGTMVERFDAAGYDGFDFFFILSGVMSLAALVFLPLIARARPRAPEEAAP
jgi:PAT family beta-lactamase induction signal transducer AmpG